MRTLFRTTFASILLTLTAVPWALAGPNEGGSLILAVCNDCEYTLDDSVYCAVQEPLDGDCATADTNLPATPLHPNIVYVYAAFPDGSLPRVTGISFGLNYTPDVLLAESGACADNDEPFDDWPRSDTGTFVSWSEPQQERLFQIYWVAAYEYYGVDTVCRLTAHADLGGNFTDDSEPPSLDPIADYGVLGFNGDPGYLPCPPALPTGACCLEDGCVQAGSSACDWSGGHFLGEGVGCDPDPCPQTPTWRASWGEVKSYYR